jgi:transcriptional regulator with XRE-family HTH domain
MSDFEAKLAKDLDQEKEYREAYAEAFGNEYLATQIQMLRKQHGWTQAQLGEKIGSNQGRVSVYEDEDYGKWSLETLRKMASVFDVWVKIGFESYGTLIREAAHFEPRQLLLPEFENDLEVRRWLEPEPEIKRERSAFAAVARWAEAVRPDRGLLAGWLQGFDLPGFVSRDATPAQYLLESVPEAGEEIWNVISRELAALMTAEESEVAPLVRSTATYRDNLFALAKTLGPRPELQDGLSVVYLRAEQRFERTGRSGLGYEGANGLVEAMTHNQVDRRWQEIWDRYISGGDHPEDFSPPGHPFLPGRISTGIRGLLGMPQGDGYWDDVARGVRDVERRFLTTGFATVESTISILDELAKAIAVVFDWWADPRAAQSLMEGSINLMSADLGTWSMFAQSAWAYAVCRKGWLDAVRTGSKLDRKKYADILASGLKLFTDWQLARKQRLGTSHDDEDLRRYEAESEEISRAVMAPAA